MPELSASAFFVGVVVVLILLWLYARQRSSGCNPCQMRRRGRGRMVVQMAPSCPKCGAKMPHNVCPKCGSCSECRAEDKCGVCQRFQRQTSLAERAAACQICDMKPCKCPNASGHPVMREPGVARDGVFSDPVVSTL